MRVVLSELEAARFKAGEYTLKFSWFPAIFVVPLIIFSMAWGASQPIEQSPESVPTTGSPARPANETFQPTVHVNPTVTPEHQKVPKSQPTMTPTPTDPLKPTGVPERQGKAQPIPTDAPEPTPNASLPKTVVVIKTPTPRPEKKVFDRSHHVATAADLVKLADPDTKKALLNPVFFDVSEAKATYTDSELVIGLSVNGQHRAYSTSFMATWIVNDTVGGDPLLVTY
ncbi:MAG TPA: DUF3179 domain-containing protein [Gammaproteobacteria bacterium]|nr:DUF3179 domain-containing protein [Gammaproteobacteria bacterium]